MLEPVDKHVHFPCYHNHRAEKQESFDGMTDKFEYLITNDNWKNIKQLLGNVPPSLPLSLFIRVRLCCCLNVNEADQQIDWGVGLFPTYFPPLSHPNVPPQSIHTGTSSALRSHRQ
jgi:hypothetical protein